MEPWRCACEVSGKVNGTTVNVFSYTCLAIARTGKNGYSKEGSAIAPPWMMMGPTWCGRSRERVDDGAIILGVVSAYVNYKRLSF